MCLWKDNERNSCHAESLGSSFILSESSWTLKMTDVGGKTLSGQAPSKANYPAGTQVTALGLQTIIFSSENNSLFSVWGLGQTVWHFVQCDVHWYIRKASLVFATQCHIWGSDLKREQEEWAGCRSTWWKKRAALGAGLLCKVIQITTRYQYLQMSRTALLITSHCSKHFI